MRLDATQVTLFDFEDTSKRDTDLALICLTMTRFCQLLVTCGPTVHPVQI